MARHPGKVYGASKGSRPGEKHYYRTVYSASRWDQFLTGRAEGVVLQVCCGGSAFGLARVDKDAGAPGVNVIADMLHLPFRDRAFDTVACDPIYQLGFPDRIRLQRELARCARRRLIFKAPWIPRATGWTLRETVLLGSHTCANVAVLSVLDREPQTAKLLVEHEGLDDYTVDDHCGECGEFERECLCACRRLLSGVAFEPNRHGNPAAWCRRCDRVRERNRLRRRYASDVAFREAVRRRRRAYYAAHEAQERAARVARWWAA